MPDAALRTTYQIAGPEMALRGGASSTPPERPLTDDEQKEKVIVDGIMEARERYGKDRLNKEREWTESFKMYMSWIDTALNPFLSNLFIPKTHEAVELLAAFLQGNNQTITASPENGSSSPQKAMVAARWLDWMWRKTLHARFKVLIWIKQAITFGNGWMKVGWDSVEGRSWMEVRPIEDVYQDYWLANPQDSEYIIDEIPRSIDEIKADEKYDAVDGDGKLIRDQVITGGPDGDSFRTTALFNVYDGSLQTPKVSGKGLVVEAHCKATNEIITLLPTALGWRIARKKENPNFYRLADDSKLYFRPFVKVRFTPSPLPNRAYDTGAVYPTIKIQKAFNDLINEYFDAVVQLGSPMWFKRRGARINPMELVRRPGGVITMSDINNDLKKEVVGDVPQSTLEMLNRLDNEFQQASMIVNLLKGFPGADTATEAALGQKNVETLLDMVNENLVDALSELGHMIFAIAQENTEGLQSIKLFETDQEIGMLEFDPKDISGVLDIIIRPDRDMHTPVAVQQEQLLKFITLIRGDAAIQAKYPDIMDKLYKEYLEKGGIADGDYFFTAQAKAPQQLGPQKPQGPVPSVSMSYKDAPDDVRREIEAAAGLKPSAGGTGPDAQQVLPEGIKQIMPPSTGAPVAAPAAAVV